MRMVLLYIYPPLLLLYIYNTVCIGLGGGGVWMREVLLLHCMYVVCVGT